MIGHSTVKLERSNPYPGLRPFEKEDAQYFFGRTQQIKELRARLDYNRVVTIIGGSGSGKSSIVRAGLLPSLSGVDLGTAGRLWQPIVCTPGKSANEAERRSPLFSIARAFDGVLLRTGDGQDRIVRIADAFNAVGGFGRLVELFSDSLRVDPGRERLRASMNYLFVVDQFEELFSDDLKASRETASVIARVVENWQRPHPRAFGAASK